MGQAYGFFDCRASKGDIEAELPTVRDLARVPSALELSLIEGVENLTGDERLMALAKEAKESGMRYVMEAKFPSDTNKQTAGELGDVLNSIYTSSLFDKGEPFKGAVVYEENGKYVFRE